MLPYYSFCYTIDTVKIQKKKVHPLPKKQKQNKIKQKESILKNRNKKKIKINENKTVDHQTIKNNLKNNKKHCQTLIA